MLAPIFVSSLLLSALAALDLRAPGTATQADLELGASARIAATTLEVGAQYEIVLTLELEGQINPLYTWEEGYQPGGLRRPLVQIDAPAPVTLLGGAPNELLTPDDFQASFLRAPHGLRAKGKQVRIPFRLESAPKPKDSIGINVIVYLGQDTRREARFVRRRIELPLRAGAESAAEQEGDGSWGPDGVLAIGDDAPDFELFGLTLGAKTALRGLRARSDVLVLFYRGAT